MGSKLLNYDYYPVSQFINELTMELAVRFFFFFSFWPVKKNSNITIFSGKIKIVQKNREFVGSMMM